MKKLVLIMCVFLIFDSSMLQSAPAMYSVDYKLLVALHPKMGNYDLAVERHLRADVNFADHKVLNHVNAQIASLTINAKIQTDKLQKELDSVLLEIAKIEENAFAQVSEINTERKQFHGDRTRESRVKKKRRLEARQKHIEMQIQQAWDETMNPMYYTRAQSKGITDSVIHEIDIILETLSRKLDRAVIIDSDYQAIQLAPENITSAPVIGADPLSIQIYQSLLGSDLIGDVPEAYKTDPNLRVYASGMRKNIEDSFDKNIAGQKSKSPLFAKVTGVRGRLVLASDPSLDLTKQALSTIFQNHAIRTDIANRILALIK